MGRISATLTGFERILLNRLSRANTAVNLNTLRLATLQKINYPKDNPTGFVQLSGFQTQLSQIKGSLSNITDASALVSGAQLKVDEIVTQLNTIRTKLVEDENQTLTATQRSANQAAIDSAVLQIEKLAGTTIAGKHVLDGSADFSYSGTDATQVREVQVYSLGRATSQTISGTVTAAATQGTLTYTGAAGNTTAAATIDLSGLTGTASITVNNGEALTTLRDRINLERHVTGVTASVSGNDLTLKSIDYGSGAFAKVTATSGTFTVTGGDANNKDIGSDATATLNGIAVTGSGNRFSGYNNGFRYEVEFQGGFSGAFSTITASGNALQFALGTEPRDLSVLAVQGLQPTRLGGLTGNVNQLVTGGTLSGLNTNAPTAIRVVDEALAKMTVVKGHVDGYATQVIDSSSSLMSALKTKTEDSIDSINLVDVNEENVLLLKNQNLASNAAAGLTILNEQRTSIANLLKKIAGLL